MRLGEITLRHGIFLAPMAGFSDRAMRLVCHRMGAEYSVTEMISAKAVTFGDKKTFSLARIRSDEGPVAIQIFGREPDVMGRATEIISKREWGEGFVPPEGRGRVYVTGSDALGAQTIAENSGVEDPTIDLVFITDLYDTRFDEYSVLRPLSFAGT